MRAVGWNEDGKDVVFFKNPSHFIVQMGRTVVHDKIRLLERHSKIFPPSLNVRDKDEVDPSEKDVLVAVTGFGVLDNCIPRCPPFSDQTVSDGHLLDDNERLCCSLIGGNAGHECCVSRSPWNWVLGAGFIQVIIDKDLLCFFIGPLVDPASSMLKTNSEGTSVRTASSVI